MRRYLEQNAEATMQGALHDAKINAIMTPGSITLSQTTLAGEALATLQSRRISAAFVLDSGRPVGLVTMLRLLNRGTA